jgi:hypothetical protein
MTAAMIPATPAAEPTVKADPEFPEEVAAPADPEAEGEPDLELVADPDMDPDPVELAEPDADPDLIPISMTIRRGSEGDIRGVQTTVGRTGLDSDGVRVVDVSTLVGDSDGTVH